MTIESSSNGEEQILYIGTGGTGIYACTLDMETGHLSETQIAVDAPKPGFLALHPNRKYLYAVTAEKSNPSGAVRAFEIDKANLSLKPVNQESSGDNGATHLEVSRDGKSVVVSHYGGGSTGALPINADGSIGEVSGFIRHEGSSIDQGRQKEPHAHGSAIDFNSRFVCIADLGTDHIDVYELGESASLTKAAFWKAKPGAGPRHLMFHPNGKWLYSINELNSTIDVLLFDEKSGELKNVQTISTLPKDFDGKSFTAELTVTPDGKFLYGSNRGHDSTAAFKINQDDGTLELVEIEPTKGGHPRFIGLDPTGKFLIAANRDSNNLVSFRVNSDTGSLEPTGHQTEAPAPICVVFLK